MEVRSNAAQIIRQNSIGRIRAAQTIKTFRCDNWRVPQWTFRHEKNSSTGDIRCAYPGLKLNFASGWVVKCLKNKGLQKWVWTEVSCKLKDKWSENRHICFRNKMWIG